jgi:para-nitrobenzyl esterase
MKALVAIALMIPAALNGAVAPKAPVAVIDTGKLAGVRGDQVSVFKGIPYAAPPVGPLRWEPPAPAAKWPGTRDATQFGAACLQPSDHKEAWARVGPTSEDCLFLNVWRPSRPGKYPVMVFLHGGGFTYGAAGVPLYDGANLARRGVVIVTVNYRLGLLGFFAHPALTRADPDGPHGNYGIMDQIAALRWVRHNAAAFDGDPRNVTIFGESAGAGTVQILMGSPAAAGLFDKAISESGAGGAVLAPFSQAEALGLRATDAVGLRDVTAAQLRAIPVEKLLHRSFPFIDGRVVVASPGTAFARGREAKVPLMIGANSNEATLASNNENAARTVLGPHYDQSLADYSAAPLANPRQKAPTALAEDALSILPSLSIAVMHAASGAPAYDYYFAQVPASRRAAEEGVAHGGELEYLFGNPDEGSTWDDADRNVSDQMENYWVRFARTGDPNGDSAAHWPRVNTAERPAFMVLSTPSSSTVLSAPREAVRKASLATSASGWEKEQ